MTARTSESVPIFLAGCRRESQAKTTIMRRRMRKTAMPNQMKMSQRSSGNPTNDLEGARLRDAASRGQGCRDLTNMRRGGAP